MTPKARSDVRVWEIEGEGVVYDPDSGMGHVLNSTALHIWSLCDGRHSPTDIEKALISSYPDKSDVIHGDVAHVIRQFSDLNLLELVF